MVSLPKKVAANSRQTWAPARRGHANAAARKEGGAAKPQPQQACLLRQGGESTAVNVTATVLAEGTKRHLHLCRVDFNCKRELGFAVHVNGILRRIEAKSRAGVVAHGPQEGDRYEVTSALVAVSPGDQVSFQNLTTGARSALRVR